MALFRCGQRFIAAAATARPAFIAGKGAGLARDWGKS
jgi:hypothetical protein